MPRIAFGPELIPPGLFIPIHSDFPVGRFLCLFGRPAGEAGCIFLKIWYSHLIGDPPERRVHLINHIA